MDDNENSNLDFLFSNAEPWEKWESKLVLGSVLIALIGLVFLGVLINWLLL